MEQFIDTNEFVIFQFAGNEYGINIRNVQEITVMMPITRVPETPKFVKGVINLRSDIVPIINLREKLGLAENGFTEDTRIVVTVHKDVKAGIIVDSVVEVINIDENCIKNMPGTSESDLEDYVYGIGKIDDRIIALVDIEKIINLN